jgi:hypothetical protein
MLIKSSKIYLAAKAKGLSLQPVLKHTPEEVRTSGKFFAEKL